MANDFLNQRKQQGLVDEALNFNSESDLLCVIDDKLAQHGRSTVDFGLLAANKHHKKTTRNVFQQQTNIIKSTRNVF